MAAKSVLRSRDSLRQSHIRNSRYNHNPKPNNRSNMCPEFNGRNENNNMIPDRTASNSPYFPKKMIMGQVKILKRGDPLPEGNKIVTKPQPKKTIVHKKVESGNCNDSDLILGSTRRLGPEPELVQKQIKVRDFYTGSAALVESPHPSSLPLPAALTKKEKKIHSITSDIPHLPRLVFQ